MRERLKQLTAVSVLLLVAGGSLVACGDKDGAKADGVGESAGGTLTKANFFDEITAAQAKAATSHVVMSVDVAGQAIKADGDLKVGETPKDTAMAMSMQTGQAGLASIEMRLVDQVFYLNFGPMTSNKFAKVDLTDQSNPIGKQYSEIVGSLDPSQQLKDFEGAVSSFKQKGKTLTLDGVKAQPYVIGIDTSKIPSAEQASGAMPKKLDVHDVRRPRQPAAACPHRAPRHPGRRQLQDVHQLLQVGREGLDRRAQGVRDHRQGLLQPARQPHPRRPDPSIWRAASIARSST